MKKKELRQKNKNELNEILADHKQRLGQLKYELASKKHKNVMEIRTLRKEIARIITLLKQKND